MLLFFRIVVTILLSGLRRKVGPLESATVYFRAWPHDCDLNFHLNAGRYVSFMDVARVELIARMRVLRRALKRGWRPVVGGATITYRRSVMPFERFSITSRVAAWDEKWFYIEHLVHKQDGTLAATGVMRTLLRGPNGNVAPREMLALLGAEHLRSPEVPR
ncbi:MAG TPA: thioesterase family protein [Thermoanaerobaculia bacterium]|jgi:acyl-CoA thioesterase FadM|nr:thioesterase family protein [Thermoanaerobaculia bacterium]